MRAFQLTFFAVALIKFGLVMLVFVGNSFSPNDVEIEYINTRFFHALVLFGIGILIRLS